MKEFSGPKPLQHSDRFTFLISPTNNAKCSSCQNDTEFLLPVAVKYGDHIDRDTKGLCPRCFMKEVLGVNMNKPKAHVIDGWHWFTMCKECNEVLGVLFEEDDITWSIHADKHEHSGHTSYTTIKIPKHMVHPQIMEQYPDVWKKFYHIDDNNKKEKGK